MFHDRAPLYTPRAHTLFPRRSDRGRGYTIPRRVEGKKSVLSRPSLDVTCWMLTAMAREMGVPTPFLLSTICSSASVCTAGAIERSGAPWAVRCARNRRQRCSDQITAGVGVHRLNNAADASSSSSSCCTQVHASMTPSTIYLERCFFLFKLSFRTTYMVTTIHSPNLPGI